MQTQVVPRLTTARLVLAPPWLGDLDDSAAMWGDPQVVRFIGGRTSTREEAWHRLLRYAGLWSLLGYGYWVAREAATGRFVGEVGFADFRRDLSPGLGDAPEAGWALATWAHGRGFGREALSRALGWMDAARPGERTCCIIDEANLASIRLAEACGYARYGQGTYRETRPLLFERTAPQP